MIEGVLTFNSETTLKLKPSSGPRDAQLLKLAIDGNSVKKIVECPDGSYDLILAPTPAQQAIVEGKR